MSAAVLFVLKQLLQSSDIAGYVQYCYCYWSAGCWASPLLWRTVWKCPRCHSGSQWMYGPAVLTGCTYVDCVHVYQCEWDIPPPNFSTSEEMYLPLNIKKRRLPECLGMWTIFFQSHVYSFTLKCGGFCRLYKKSYFNNRCEFTT